MKRTQHKKPNAGVRGNGFFGFAETMPYAPMGVLFGQSNEFSCVPACTRMLIVDHWPEAQNEPNFSEAYLRTQFRTAKEGSAISRIPAVLQTSGVGTPYLYRSDLSLEDLEHSLRLGNVIAVLRDARNIHVVIVEQMVGGFVAIRDSLPPGAGSAYWVALELFLAAWLKNSRGTAIVVDLNL